MAQIKNEAENEAKYIAGWFSEMKIVWLFLCPDISSSYFLDLRQACVVFTSSK